MRAKRLGRPPASSSTETRERLVEVARRFFAESGYEATTNRALAEEAGITTGAIYHYFDSKLAIYKAVFEDVRSLVYRELEQASTTADTFVGKLEAVLERAHALNRTDPSLALFLGAARVDARRHPEIAGALMADWSMARNGFFAGMVDVGIASGEIAPGLRDAAIMLISVITVGLTDAVSDDPATHRLAVNGVVALLKGELTIEPLVVGSP